MNKKAPIGSDGSSRRYFRLNKDNKTAILMEQIGAETAGHSMDDFIRIGDYLRDKGLNTPEILEQKNNSLLLEDFGDMSFKNALENGTDAETLYTLATNVLSRMQKCNDIELPNYYDSHVHKGHRRIIDWYLPAMRGEKNTDGLVEEYLNVWAEIEQSLPPCPQGFLHIDFHVENLMWLPQNEGLAQCGILDFQGAMHGPTPYDLANLLEDARIDVPEKLRRAMLEHFCADMTQEERDNFQNWYRVLATQFHCRIAGQFIKLAINDNKTNYLQYLPRVISYLKEGLKHPVLEPLQEWFLTQNINFDEAPFIEPDKLKPLIRDDAF